MLILPAIDIRNGNCVRLVQGEFNSEIVYSDDPVQMAILLEKKGAKRLHVVDLDGAANGQSENLPIIKDMAKEISIPIELGGGVRHVSDIMLRLERIKVGYTILGTLAAEKPEVMKWAAKDYPGKIIVGIDARDGVVAVKGWMDEAIKLTPLELALEAKEAGVDTVVYTDISKDGMLQGPNIEATKKLIEETGMNVIASGGVSSMEDLKQLEDIGAYGAIVGKAMYDGLIDIEEAIKTFDK